jgi:hypothetical protein
MWIVPPLVCALAIVVALLPPAEPIEDPRGAGNDVETTWPMPTVMVSAITLATVAIALRTVLAT